MEVRGIVLLFPAGHEISLLTKTSGPIIDTTKPPIEWINEESYSAIKRPVHEND
jgi:hypothetical protein